jgi:hypothetical protein
MNGLLIVVKNRGEFLRRDLRRGVCGEDCLNDALGDSSTTFQLVSLAYTPLGMTVREDKSGGALISQINDPTFLRRRSYKSTIVMSTERAERLSGDISKRFSREIPKR